jgi:hypothetical protein
MRWMLSCCILLALTGGVSAGQGGGYGTYTYDDILKSHGRSRGEAAEQAATLICDRGDADRIGTRAFNACMLSRGWRLARFEPAPRQWRDPDTGLWCKDTTFFGIPASQCSNY